MRWPFTIFRKAPPKPAPQRPDTPGGAERVCLASEEGGRSTEPKFSRCDPPRLPAILPLTEQEARHLLAEGLLKVVHDQGPTRVALTIGCQDEKTVRRARDGTTTLRIDFVFNALLADENALSPLLEHFRKRLVDKDPAPVDWPALGAAMAEASAEIFRALGKGHVSHLDTPKLKTLVRRVMALGQGAA